MIAFFENTDTEALVELPIAAGQASYEVKLPAGPYIAYAWLEDFSRGGLYSRAVPCGLQTGCDDHTLLTFTAVERRVLQDIDLCDWYAGPFNVPYPPGRQPDEVTGVISGSIVYPGDSAPKMRVVASNTQTEYWYWVYTESSQGFYAVDDLPPGQYYIVAYLDDGQAGAHATADHDLIAVTIEPGKVTEGVTINDWDAPADVPPRPNEIKWNFNVQAPFQPTGDQPEAIRQLVEGVKNGAQLHQVLLGATGTGNEGARYRDARQDQGNLRRGHRR